MTDDQNNAEDVKKYSLKGIVSAVKDRAKRYTKNTWNLAKKYPKTAAIIGAATIIGTSGNEGFPPIHNIIARDGWGINFGLYTEVLPGKSFKGINLSLFTKNEGTIYGINVDILGNENNGKKYGVNIAGLWNDNDGEVYGLNIAGGWNHNDEKVRGVNIAGLWNDNDGDLKGVNLAGITNVSNEGKIAGLEVAIAYNSSNAKNLLQLGSFNRIMSDDGKSKWGLGANWKYNSKAKKAPTKGK